MANRRDGDHHNNDGGDDVNNPVLTRAEFLDFHDENQQFHDSTQQTLEQIQEALANLLNRNLNCNDEEWCDNWARGPPHRAPNRNRQQDYNEEDSEDEKYAERVLGNHRGPARDNGRDYQEQRDYRMKVELPSFNGNVSIEEYLDWVSEVEKFFDYMSTADDKQVYLVVYKLKGGASAWWDRVQLNCIRERKLPIQSWRRMKRLMVDWFLPPNYQQELFRQY